MPWEDIFAQAFVEAAHGDIFLLIIFLILFMVAVVIAPTAVYMAKKTSDTMNLQGAMFRDAFSQNETAIAGIVAAQNASSERIIASQAAAADRNTKAIERMAEAIISRMDENHDESMDAFNRQERHTDCIKRDVIEMKTVVCNHGRG